MKRLANAVMSGMFVALSLPCVAEPACPKLVVEAGVEIGQGELTLADLLAPGSCPQWHQAAAQVSLGATPRPGSARVLDGRRVRLLLEGLGSGQAEHGLAKHPERELEEVGECKFHRASWYSVPER